MSKNLFFSLAACVVVGFMGSSCGNEDNPTVISTVTRLTATLNAASEKPTSTTSPATGMFLGNLNTATRVLSYTVTYQGFPANDQPNMGHLHRTNAANGTGPVEVPFPNLTNPIAATSPVLRQTQVDSMLNGFYYANIHTPGLPAGAIRGDIKKQ